MVRRVGGEVGRLAAAADQDVVLELLLALVQRGRAEPDGGVALDDVPAPAQERHRLFVGGRPAAVGLVEGAFGGPAVELDADEFEVAADAVEHRVETGPDEVFGRRVIG